MKSFICQGVDLKAISKESLALFVECGMPLTPSDLCDGPVRSAEGIKEMKRMWRAEFKLQGTGEVKTFSFECVGSINVARRKAIGMLELTDRYFSSFVGLCDATGEFFI